MVVRSSLRNGRTAFPTSWNLGKKQSSYAKKGTWASKKRCGGVLVNTEHRMRHWLQLVAIPNAPECVHKQELTDIKKRMAATENRSRLPWRQQQQQRALTCPSFLALPAPASSSSQPASSQGKLEKGKSKGKKGFERADRRSSPKFCKNQSETGTIYTSATTPRRSAGLFRKTLAGILLASGLTSAPAAEATTTASASQKSTNSTDPFRSTH